MVWPTENESFALSNGKTEQKKGLAIGKYERQRKTNIEIERMENQEPKQR